MLGWSFLVQSPAKETLAYWEASLGGYSWLEERGEMILDKGGYPNKFTVRLGDIRDILADPPDLTWWYEREGDWVKNAELLQKLSDQNFVEVEVWDQS